MNKKVDVVIIGAGSAGLSALREVKKETSNYLLVDRGVLGTKCARVGCMPSKALLYAARDFSRRKFYERMGISGCEDVNVNIARLLGYVREVRDGFADSMVDVTKNLAGDNLRIARAKIIGEGKVKVDDDVIECKSIILAAGSSPKVPGKWMEKFGDKILTSDNIFEQEDLPRRIALIGLGTIGLEIGQSLSRLGVEIAGFDMKDVVGNITDPDINLKAIELLKKDFPLYMGQGVDVEERGGKIIVKSGEVEKEFDAIFSAMGVVPNLEGLGLENCGLKLNEKGMPKVNPLTLQVENKALYIAGDVNGNRPILHEALDEGFAAGSNSVSQEVDSFCRRVSLNIVFCEPEIVMVGRSYEKLKRESVDFITGEVDFSDQARAKLEHRNEGLGHVYVSKADGRILGAEMICPDGEHLGHQLAQAIENDLYLADMLRCPFYHPSIEEGLRIALLDAAQQLPQEQRPGKVTLCSSRPEEPLN